MRTSSGIYVPPTYFERSLTAENAALRAENARLRAQLSLIEIHHQEQIALMKTEYAFMYPLGQFDAIAAMVETQGLQPSILAALKKRDAQIMGMLTVLDNQVAALGDNLSELGPLRIEQATERHTALRTALQIANPQPLIDIAYRAAPSLSETIWDAKKSRDKKHGTRHDNQEERIRALVKQAIQQLEPSAKSRMQRVDILCDLLTRKHKSEGRNLRPEYRQMLDFLGDGRGSNVRKKVDNLMHNAKLDVYPPHDFSDLWDASDSRPKICDI